MAKVSTCSRRRSGSALGPEEELLEGGGGEGAPGPLERVDQVVDRGSRGAGGAELVDPCGSGTRLQRPLAVLRPQVQVDQPERDELPGPLGGGLRVAQGGAGRTGDEDREVGGGELPARGAPEHPVELGRQHPDRVHPREQVHDRGQPERPEHERQADLVGPLADGAAVDVGEELRHHPGDLLVAPGRVGGQAVAVLAAPVERSERVLGQVGVRGGHGGGARVPEALVAAGEQAGDGADALLLQRRVERLASRGVEVEAGEQALDLVLPVPQRLFRRVQRLEQLAHHLVHGLGRGRRALGGELREGLLAGGGRGEHPATRTRDAVLRGQESEQRGVERGRVDPGAPAEVVDQGLPLALRELREDEVGAGPRSRTAELQALGDQEGVRDLGGRHARLGADRPGPLQPGGRLGHAPRRARGVVVDLALGDEAGDVRGLVGALRDRARRRREALELGPLRVRQTVDAPAGAGHRVLGEVDAGRVPGERRPRAVPDNTAPGHHRSGGAVATEGGLDRAVAQTLLGLEEQAELAGPERGRRVGGEHVAVGRAPGEVVGRDVLGVGASLTVAAGATAELLEHPGGHGVCDDHVQAAERLGLGTDRHVGAAADPVGRQCDLPGPAGAGDDLGDAARPGLGHERVDDLVAQDGGVGGVEPGVQRLLAHPGVVRLEGGDEVALAGVGGEHELRPAGLRDVEHLAGRRPDLRVLTGVLDGPVRTAQVRLRVPRGDVDALPVALEQDATRRLEGARTSPRPPPRRRGRPARWSRRRGGAVR